MQIQTKSLTKVALALTLAATAACSVASNADETDPQSIAPEAAESESALVGASPERTLDELNVEIYVVRYAVNGTSKAKRLRCFLQMVDAQTPA